MRRLIAYFNSLLLGMILGMIFVAIIHAPQFQRQEKVHGPGITIGCEIFGAKDQTTVLLIAGTATHLVSLPADFCSYLGNRGCHASSPHREIGLSR
jgi:hypothetical protein